MNGAETTNFNLLNINVEHEDRQSLRSFSYQKDVDFVSRHNFLTNPTYDHPNLQIKCLNINTNNCNMLRANFRSDVCVREK